MSMNISELKRFGFELSHIQPHMPDFHSNPRIDTLNSTFQLSVYQTEHFISFWSPNSEYVGRTPIHSYEFQTGGVYLWWFEDHFYVSEILDKKSISAPISFKSFNDALDGVYSIVDSDPNFWVKIPQR